eukprot:COSAG04_NODE_2244_length_4461_cov_20.784732_3_plen_47_part_00
MRSQHPELAIRIVWRNGFSFCLDARAGCSLALGSGLWLVGTASSRR